MDVNVWAKESPKDNGEVLGVLHITADEVPRNGDYIFFTGLKKNLSYGRVVTSVARHFDENGYLKEISITVGK